MSNVKAASNISSPTQFLETKKEKYAYRRFGNGRGLPLLFLQHFTGTLDNWDPAVTDPLATGREVILREPVSGPEIAQAQMAAFREWDQITGERFAVLKGIREPTLVVNGVHDEMIAVRISYWLGENLPNAVLLTYPDSGHGSLFQFHESFTRHAAAFLNSDSQFAPY